jgi:lysozyme
MKALGIDVSFWNGTMDFNKARDAGATFVYMKASELYADSKFKTFWNAAKGILPRGAYHYLNWFGKELDQAVTFSNLLKDDSGELPPCLDLEDDPSLHNLTPREVQGKVWNFLTYVEKATGRIPMLYTGYYFWKQWGNTNKEWAKYPFWLPWYASESIVKVPLPWKKWTFWQYTSNGPGLVYGSQGKSMDMNYFNGTEEELKAYISGIPVPPPPQPVYVIYTPKPGYNLVVRSEASFLSKNIGIIMNGETFKVLNEEPKNGYIYAVDIGWVWKDYSQKVAK